MVTFLLPKYPTSPKIVQDGWQVQIAIAAFLIIHGVHMSILFIINVGMLSMQSSFL